MFQELRNNSKRFIWVIVLAFVGLIFLVWGDFLSTQGGGSSQGARQSSEVGRVNGEAIDANAYQRLVNTTYQNVVAQSGGQPVDDQTATLIKNQAWGNLVQQSLLRRAARNRDIRVTNDEVVDAVLNNPPPDFQSVPQFQTNGQFDISKYQALMRSPTFDSRPVEESFRASLPIDKLQQELMATAVVSEEELWQNFQLRNDTRKISYLRVSSADFSVDESGIDSAALESHYEAHKTEYRIPAEATVEFVLFPKIYSTEDSLGTYDLAASLVEDAKIDDLLELMDLSEAPSNQQGGETAAWISPNALSPAVRSAVAALPVGEVSDVIIEPRGFHVVRIEEKREDEVAGSQIKIADVYLPLRANPETLTAIRENAIGFRTEVGNGDLTDTAIEYEVSVRQTSPFGERGFVAGLGSAPEVQRFAFRNKVGTVSPPIERAKDWLVVRVTDRRDSRVPEMSEVLARVRREAADLMRRKMAAAKASELLPRIEAGEDMSSLAATDVLLTFDTVESVNRLGGRGVGSDPEILGPVFARTSGLIDEVLTARAGAFIVRVDDATPADRSAFDSQKLDLRRSLLQERQSQLMTKWLSNLQASAEVQDFRFGSF